MQTQVRGQVRSSRGPNQDTPYGQIRTALENQDLVRTPEGQPVTARVNKIIWKTCRFLATNTTNVVNLTQAWTDSDVLIAANLNPDLITTAVPVAPANNPPAILWAEGMVALGNYGFDQSAAADPDRFARLMDWLSMVVLATQGQSGGDIRSWKVANYYEQGVLPAGAFVGSGGTNAFEASVRLGGAPIKMLEGGPVYVNLATDTFVAKPTVATPADLGPIEVLFGFLGHTFTNTGALPGDAGGRCNEDPRVIADMATKSRERRDFIRQRIGR